MQTSIDTLTEIRSELNLMDRLYFNHGGQGLMPGSSLEAILAAYRKMQQLGPFSLGCEDWIEEQVRLVRAQLAAEFGVSPQGICFTESTSHGLNIALWGFRWQRGDGVLLSDCEHPGAINPVRRAAERFGLEVRTFAMTEDPLAAVAAALGPNTRMLVLSHVLWNTGAVLPLAEITALCRSAGVLVLWDGAQGAGVLPVDLAASGVDLYASTCHKWLMGPAGTGFLYVNPALAGVIEPMFVGWRSGQCTGDGTRWWNDARCFEVGTMPRELLLGLGCALARHRAAGTARQRYERIVDLTTQLGSALRSIPGVRVLGDAPPRSSLVFWHHEPAIDLGQLVRRLESRQAYIRTIPAPACLRAAVHYFNTPEEIQALVELLREISGV